MRTLVLCVFLLATIGSEVAHAGKLSGKVTVESSFREALAAQEKQAGDAERLYYWQLPNSALPVALPAVSPTRDLAVIVRLDGAAEPGPDELSTVKVRAFGLEKNLVVTRPGSTLRFANVDPFDHELYSPGLASFTPEAQANGAFRPIEFPTEGLFEVRCKLFPHFVGYVLVTKATFVLPLAADGTFSLNEAQPGNYKVSVVFRGAVAATESVVIEEGGWKEASVALKLGKLPASDTAGTENKGDAPEK